MIDTTLVFTAARIASVLGRDKRGLLRILGRIPPTGKVLVRGNQMADAWSVENLPAHYRADLERLAKIKQCRSADHLLAEGLTRWNPPIPLNEIARHQVDRAVRVKNAFTRAIALYGNPRVTIGEVRRAAWEDYQKEFGVISERQVRRVFDRVLTRDAGEEHFDDLSLYLDDRLSREKTGEAVLPGLLSPHEQAIFRYLSAVKTPSEPTVEELDLIWFAVCESLHVQVEERTKERVARRAMTDFLEKSPVRLSFNRDALKKQVVRKYARYLECAGDFNLMCDQRGEKSGWRRALVLPDQDRELIVAHAALQKGGRIAPAIRDLRNDGMLSQEFVSHHLANPSRKSYVPQSVRDQVQPDVRRLKNMEHGPRTHELNGAYLTRNYDAMAAGDYWQADDVTLPCYFWDETENGPARMRGQFLVMIDVRTDFILGFLLIPERNYDSLAIRSLITVCASKHGLPRRGFYFERGIWKSSKIISGSASALPFEHADRGLRGLGMELHHARLPRGKVIERTIGQLQNRMEGLPGYAGRDERHDIRERAQRVFLDVDAGRSPMNEKLFSKSQYCEQLARIIEDHNAEPQEGTRLQGMSPAEAWERLQGDRPRQGFGSKWRYVLARDVRKVKVGRNGITLRYGKKPFVYHDAETGKRVGEEVLAWFDPMLPDVLACTDLDRKNVFSVELAKEVPAMDAPPKLLHDEMSKADAHQAYAKSLYWTSRNTLKDRHYVTTIADVQTVRMGEDFDQQREKIAARNDERERRGRTNRSIVQRDGLPSELLREAPNLQTETVKALSQLLSEPEDDGNGEAK